MSDDCPVIIIHQGNQAYIQTAMRRAEASGNPVRWIDRIDDFDAGAAGYDDFIAHYRHMSTNNEDYELWCFKRYFILETAMRESGLEHAWMLDSDVLVFDDMGKVAKRAFRPRGMDNAVGITMRRGEFLISALGHTSYWTLKAISEFTAFLRRAYREQDPYLERKWVFHRDGTIPGGVCDMTLLYMWAHDRPTTFNTLRPFDGCAVDANFNTPFNYCPQEYRTRLGHKRIAFRGGQPHGTRAENGERVRFLSLHFQGGAKRYMEAYAEGKALATDAVLLLERLGLKRMAGAMPVRLPAEAGL